MHKSKTVFVLVVLASSLYLPAHAQNQTPDDVYSIGKTNFAFYASSNTTEVMAGGLTIFEMKVLFLIAPFRR